MLWINNNLYTTCYKKEKNQWMQLWKNFIWYSFIRYIMCHNGYKPCEHRNIKRSNIHISISKQWEYMFYSNLDRLSECGRSLQLICFLIFLGIYPNYYYRTSLWVLGIWRPFCFFWFTVNFGVNHPTGKKVWLHFVL